MAEKPLKTSGRGKDGAGQQSIDLCLNLVCVRWSRHRSIMRQPNAFERVGATEIHVSNGYINGH